MVQESPSKQKSKSKPNHRKRRSTKSSTSLKSRRPPLFQHSSNSNSSSLSSKATRNLIRSHHTLQKQLAQAQAKAKSNSRTRQEHQQNTDSNENTTDHDDNEEINQIKSLLDHQGGLESYQLASSLGQSKIRGGDSSKVLVEWIRSSLDLGKSGRREVSTTEEKILRILEVGALSTKNALNTFLSRPPSGFSGTGIRRIDLRSRDRDIEEVDFMDLPLPLSLSAQNVDGQGSFYDIISLSLVLNFVPDPVSRGEMLRRTTLFFPRSEISTSSVLPCLFLVLPLACVNNSRYLTEVHLTDIMEVLGYEKVKVKESGKLYYSLWRFDKSRAELEKGRLFGKTEIRGGKDRNNFCVVLK